MKTEHPFINDMQKLSKNVAEIKSILLTKERSKLVYSNNEFCELMSISKTTAKTWRKEGKISYSSIGNKTYYTIDSIYKLLDNHIIQVKKKG